MYISYQLYKYLFLGAIAVPRFYEKTISNTVLSGVQCTGFEKSLMGCNSTMLPVTCPPQQTDAGVVCQDIATEKANCSDGQIRLVNGTNILEGRVEVCINSAWGSTCDNFFSEDEATVICKQLGHRFNGNNNINLQLN